ncbi:RNB domain-containing ribonuclease [Salinibacterium metalliresistens]|uniref:RNB domain-containing ribonuclease n=1 Tax=Salinibacterium metalliresistens TaxID=3031321 RepID=UPI0030B84732
MKNSERSNAEQANDAEARSRVRTTVPLVRFRDARDELASALRVIRDELELPESFSPEVEREAREAAERVRPTGPDLTGIPFITIDPAASTDLDQALHLERLGDGFRVRYAIADVPAFVEPGGAIDAAARERGQTLYAPDGRIPLHPTVLSEGAASLLEGDERPAFVWTFDLDARGEVTATTLDRATVRSARRYSYREAQDELDGGAAGDSLTLLPEVGGLRLERERERGGASLDRPEEEVVLIDGRYRLERRSPLPVESWNAQLSLMTGMAAAQIMIDGGIGILRTMPAPDAATIERFRAQVAAIGCPWPESQRYGEYLRTLDRADPRGLAVLHAAGALFRGAGYTAFDGEPPQERIQAAIAAPYAHATAPLRRLVDRFVLVACEALAHARPVPDWVREALPELPAIMGRSDSLASRLDRAAIDAIEAAVLHDRVGERFEAVVIAAKNGGGTVQLSDPFISAAVEGEVRAGERVGIVLESADIATGTIRFRLA